MLAGLGVFFFLSHGPSPCLSTSWCVESQGVESGVFSLPISV